MRTRIWNLLVKTVFKIVIFIGLLKQDKPTATMLHNNNNFTKTYVEIKCQLDTTEVFIADLIACSTCFGHHYAHHQELKSIIQWLLPVVFRNT